MPGVLSGLVPACHTPFDRSGRLDLAGVSRQAEWFRELRMEAVFVAGTTGEWASLSRDERMALCDRWTESAGGSLKVAVHVGCHAQGDAVALASHARESGATAVAAVAPSYFKPATVADLVEFLIPIAAAADPLPFYYYEIPAMTGLRLSAARLLHEARFRIPNLRGLKFSHYDMVELQGCVNADDGAFDVLFGQDDFLLAGLAMGVRGAVGATYNFAGGHFRTLVQLFEAGRLAEARAAQFRAVRVVEVLASYGFLAASKAVMGLIGVDCGPVRPPLRNLGAEELARLADELTRLEVLDRSPRRPE